MSRPKPWEISDELWAVIEPLLPRHERRYRYPGRKRINDRRTLQGVLFVLYTGIQREFLPQELGFAGPTCWRRLAGWQQAGVWDELQQVLLDRLRAADPLDFSRATIDASHVQAKRGRSRPKVGPSPVDRARPGSKHHVLTDANGIPLQVSLTGANRNDIVQLLPLIDGLPPVRGKRGRPRRRPRAVYADRGYDHLPPTAPRAEHHPEDRAPRTAARLGPGPRPLGRRIRHRPPPRPPPPANPLGSTRRHPRCLPSTRPLHDARTQTPSFLKGLLNPQRSESGVSLGSVIWRQLLDLACCFPCAHYPVSLGAEASGGRHDHGGCGASNGRGGAGD